MGSQETTIERARAASANLAADEALFHRVAATGSPSWRLYVNPPCVVIGRHQDAGREANREACARMRVPVLRRFTGGGAVYHDEGNLNFAVGLPRAPARPFVLDFERFAGWIPELLASWGLAGRVAGNRVDISGRKISGLAARVGPRASFVHGTLLVSTPLAVLRELLAPPPEQIASLPPPRGPHVASRPRPETTLEAEHGRSVSMDRLREEARALLAARFGPGNGVDAGG